MLALTRYLYLAIRYAHKVLHMVRVLCVAHKPLQKWVFSLALPHAQRTIPLAKIPFSGPEGTTYPFSGSKQGYFKLGSHLYVVWIHPVSQYQAENIINNVCILEEMQHLFFFMIPCSTGWG